MSSCAYHPERDVVGACVDCGKLVCAECKTTLGGKIYCNPCAEKAYSGVTKSTSDQGRLAVIPKEVRGRNRTKWGIGLLAGIVLVSLAVIIIANWEEGSAPTTSQPSTQPAPTTPELSPDMLVFSDTFEDGWNQGWFLNDNKYLQEGAINLVTAGDESSYSFNGRIPEISSFAYQIELYFKEALPQTQGGLFLGKEQGGIKFKIWPTGQFGISTYYSPEGEWDQLKGKTSSSAIKGLGEVNKLLVIGRDASLEFYVNDVFLGSFTDPYPDSPVTKIELYVYGEGSHAAFDNVTLHSLSPLPVVTFPAVISGDPPFSSTFSKPTQTRIGPFATHTGDYFVSYTMTDAELSAYQADTSAPIRKKILEDVQANFKDSVDAVIVILDVDAPPPGNLPWGTNYGVQSGSVHNPTTTRFARLGNIWLMTRRGLANGPSLHELLHGFTSWMAQDSTANFIIPTSIGGHWGFSSAGGQLGGWDRDTLVYLGNGTYQAIGPPYASGYPERTGFGTNANGGNSIPYSNLELWSMGLIPDSELVSVDVAEDASFIEVGEFKATAIRTYSPSEIIARTISGNRPSTATPRAFRGLVVFASTRTTIDLATITQLNKDIEEFSMRSPIPGSHNFWTATGMRASIHLATASELAR